MVAIGQFSQLLITIGDVIKFDKILCQVNRAKVNELVGNEPCKISTVPLDNS